MLFFSDFVLGVKVGLNSLQVEKLHQRLRSIREALVHEREGNGEDGANTLEALDSTLGWLTGLIEGEGMLPSFSFDADREILRTPALDYYDFGNRANFVIGNRRSGTTLLTYLLNASSSICAMPENMLGGEIASNDKLIRVGHLAMPFFSRNQENFSVILGKLIDSIYSEFAASHNKTRWINKELFAPSRLDRLDALFNYQAKFIYMVRHGFDVAYSCSKRFPRHVGLQTDAKTSLNLEAYLNEWILNNELTMDFYERNSDRCLMVRYEDLTCEPEKKAKEIFSFLGETWRDDVMIKMENQSSRVMMGDHKISVRGKKIQAGNQWWQNWPLGLKKVLGKRANGTLQRLGYEPV